MSLPNNYRIISQDHDIVFVEKGAPFPTREKKDV